MKTQISAYFNDFNAGAKKDVIKLEIRGELTDEQIVKLHKLKGNSVVVTLASGQLELEDLEDEDYQYQLEKDKPNEEGQQLSIDDVKNDEASSEQAGSESDAAEADKSNEADSVPGEEGQQPEESEPEAEPEQVPQQESDKEPEAEKVADINKARTRRGRKKKEDQDKTEEQPAPESSDQDELPPLAADDDLPF
ncbi:hypothetical protein [Paenibacillus alvei]|uniref:hypothetical protein n=1 Tax=Paenibacillus alvei TaxID=44250 RepID=UPI00227F3075|nr:hypothetical protein [Paenibacillus alvei]MCY7485398.1 hypothetical protein [Paenibacillus alvei]